MEGDAYVSYMRRIYVSIPVHLYYTNPRQPKEYLLYYTRAFGPVLLHDSQVPSHEPPTPCKCIRPIQHKSLNQAHSSSPP